MKLKNLFLLGLFLSISILAIFSATVYKNQKIQEYEQKQFSSLATSLNTKVTALIEDKKNATLAMALAFTHDVSFIRALFADKNATQILKNMSIRLHDNSDFKNIWLQMIDKDGKNIARSWDELKGDDLSLVRKDIKLLIERPAPTASISVGKYDLSLKAIIPIYDEEKKLLGFIELITHFNSIAFKIKTKSIEPVVLVDEKYTKQIIKPFTQKFTANHYVANTKVNETLLKYINSKGLNYFLSNKNIYKIDAEGGYFVVNHVLNDVNNMPMANFLMFQSLNTVPLESVHNIKTSTNLVVILFILTLGFLSYLLANKEQTEQISTPYIRMLVLSALYLFTATAFYFILSWNNEKKEKEYFDTYNEEIQENYEVIYDKYASIAATMYQTTINRPEVMALLSEAYLDEEHKNNARKKLYALLFFDYEFLQKYELRQLHFHLKNNESFLRFHRPNKYGDNLSEIRATVAWTNEHQQEISGFEEGRIYNGFRHVYPLSTINTNHEKEHLGSVEISFSAYPICKEFANFHDRKTGFIIKKSIVDTKVFAEEQSNYSKSPFPNFYYESSIKEQLKHSFIEFDATLLKKGDFELVGSKIMEGELFSVVSKNKQTIFTFMPIKNSISKEVVAAFILQTDSTIYADIINNFYIFLFVGLILILFIFLYLYQEYETTQKFKLLSHKTQKIIDLQETILIITDGVRILDANQKFLNFTAYDSLVEFKKSYSCICDLFEEDENCFHLGRIEESDNWIEILNNLPQSKQIVSMYDFEQKKHFFSISINQYEENYILSFSDISDTLMQQILLKKKVFKDKLTDAYNREYLEKIFDIFTQEGKENNLVCGLVLFDIDNFKKINDTYGHNCGDNVLVTLVSCVHKSIRKEDILVRWGGEEFILLIKTNSVHNLYNIAEFVRKAIENMIFENVGQVTCSFGVTTYKDTEEKTQTISRADKALYQAKEEGRNRVIEMYQ